MDNIRANAPEGTTHKDIDGDFLKFKNNKWSVWIDDYWQEIKKEISQDDINILKIVEI